MATITSSVPIGPFHFDGAISKWGMPPEMPFRRTPTRRYTGDPGHSGMALCCVSLG